MLTQEQTQHFLDRSYVVIKNAIPQPTAEQWVERAFDRLGYDRHDPSTWAESRVHLPGRERVDSARIAPRAWAAACEIAGGADRLKPWLIGDSFIASFSVGADKPWQPPGPDVHGWHKDGGNFVHFLDSPEQALLALVCWTDVVHRGGGTFIACDSVGVVARYLADHPEGLPPGSMPFKQWINDCRDFEEVTAEAGDIVLLHPYTLHAVSQNVLRVPRIITNPPLHFRQPMNFNRPDPADFSLIERAVLQSLGVDRLDFQIQGQRGYVESNDQKRRQAMLEAELKREAAP